MAIRDFFLDRSSEAPARPAAPHSTSGEYGIGYDPLLTSQLRKDYQRQLDLFSATQSLLSGHDYAGVQRKLGEFRVVLQDHLLRINNKLYVYLNRRWANDAERAALISAVRREMLESGRSLLGRLGLYSEVRLDDRSAGMFQQELLEIGAALMQRMEREENSLFPLYEP